MEHISLAFVASQRSLIQCCVSYSLKQILLLNFIIFHLSLCGTLNCTSLSMSLHCDQLHEFQMWLWVP